MNVYTVICGKGPGKVVTDREANACSQSDARRAAECRARWALGNAAQTAICAAEKVSIGFNKKKVMLSVHGGVVSDPP
jgi:hypothetical protein